MDRQQPRTLEQGAVTRVEYQNRLVVRTSTGTPPVK
jgi:LacI family transcriptional regulator